ncbi:MAG TPA: class I SAM-dependent methyltransferase [Pirellulaceae bacterium]|nr:class I SAM-dependent methyltransferase [Planctomycetales bacterium]MCB9938622.1 class I SAM-dependent methyltransferase [Planctomycetaceae bacterium]HRX78440.1 class I SAM-dependent methyltransferase [Pirellulaceae bacterium]
MDEVANQQFLELEATHWWFRGRRRIFFHVLDKTLGNSSSRRILDVGCGAGGMLECLQRYGTTWGIDFSDEMVRLCRERGFDNVLTASATELPMENDFFDLVTFFDCLEHIDDDQAALNEALRVLRPDGLLFVSVPAYQFLYAQNDRLAHHKRRYTMSTLRTKIQAAGFKIVHTSYINFWLFPIILPAVLFIKLKERLLSADGQTTNLSYPLPQWVHHCLASIFSSERHLVSRWSVPVGHSLFLLASKR